MRRLLTSVVLRPAHRHILRQKRLSIWCRVPTEERPDHCLRKSTKSLRRKHESALGRLLLAVVLLFSTFGVSISLQFESSACCRTMSTPAACCCGTTHADGCCSSAEEDSHSRSCCARTSDAQTGSGESVSSCCCHDRTAFGVLSVDDPRIASDGLLYIRPVPDGDRLALMSARCTQYVFTIDPPPPKRS